MADKQLTLKQPCSTRQICFEGQTRVASENLSFAHRSRQLYARRSFQYGVTWTLAVGTYVLGPALAPWHPRISARRTEVDEWLATAALNTA